jgi:hypothetical protein
MVNNYPKKRMRQGRIGWPERTDEIVRVVQQFEAKSPRIVSPDARLLGNQLVFLHISHLGSMYLKFIQVKWHCAQMVNYELA